MEQFKNIVRDVRDFGVFKNDRTGVGTYSMFGRLERFDVSCGKVILPSTKEVTPEHPYAEKLWMLGGGTTIKFLRELNINFWNNWVKPGTHQYIVEENAHKRAFDTMKREPREQWLASREINDKCLQWITTEDKTGVEGWQKDSRLITGDGPAKWRHVGEIGKILHASLDELGVPPGRLVDGDLGPIYGKQWTAWEDTKIINSGELEKYQRRGYEVMGLLDDTGMQGEMIQDRYVVNRKINQIQNAIDLLKNSPDSRRIIVSAWNPADIEEQALPACHTLFEFWNREMNFAEIVSMLKHRGANLYEQMTSSVLGAGSGFSGLHYGYEGDNHRHEEFMALVWAWLVDNKLPTRTLSLLFFCRSQDLMVGTPYNLAAYSMLLHMFAEQVNMATNEVIWVAGDHHLYQNHLEQVDRQLKRQPIPGANPTIRFNRKPDSIFDYTIEDVDVLNYQHLSRIFLPVAE